MFLQMLQGCVLPFWIYALYPVLKLGQSIPELQEETPENLQTWDAVIVVLDSNFTFPYWGLDRQRGVQQEIHTKDQGRRICLAVRFHSSKLEKNLKIQSQI